MSWRSSLALRLSDPSLWRGWLLFLGLFLLIFLPVYIGAGYLNALWPERAWRLYLPWETQIPLVPWMVWPYLSLYTVYLLPLLHLDPAGLRRLALQSVAAVLVAGVVFLAFPSRSGFAPVDVDSLHGPVVRLIALVDTPFNLVPSLHVTCAALILLACAQVAAPRLRWAYFAWMAVLALSTVLVHQHHLIDIVAGFALAAAARLALPIRRGAGTAR